MNAKDLELKISGLEKVIKEQQESAEQYKVELADTKKKLEDINKPELTPLQFDLITEAIEEGVGEFDFSNTDNYDKEFGIDYDGRVTLDHFDLTETCELVEMITERVHKLFTEAECPNQEEE